MKKRILASSLLIPFLAGIFFGGYVLLGVTYFCMVVGLHELYKGFNNAGIKPSKIIGYISLGLIFVYTFFFEFDFTVLFLILVFTLMASFIYNFNLSERKISDPISTLFGVIYISLFILLILIDQTPARVCNWYIVIISFGTDIFAYFVGYLLGKHKLCPELSPKKTIEGAIGGLIGAVILSIVFNHFVTMYPIVYVIGLSVIGSVFAQLGDLSASSLKRQMDIKDYGKLIPGHGGILDRFDSILFVAPIVYLFVIVFC